MNPIIVIPTYNEAENAEAMVKVIFDEVFKTSNITVLIVDGNSPDKTAEKIKNLQTKYPNLHLIVQQEKNGLAKAYIEGFKWALEHNYDTFIQMDCDFQHPVEVLPQMLEKISQYDVVIGSRYVKGGGWEKYKSKVSKEYTSRFGSFYAKTILGCKINDLTGGFNIYTKKALEAINISKITSAGFCFQIEMKYYAYKAGLNILEFPIIFKPRLKGKSKMDLNIVFEGFFKLLKIKLHNF